MKFSHPQNPRAVQIESLKTEQQHLLLLQEHHLRWMKDADNPRIATRHEEMVNLFIRAEAQLRFLLKDLEAQLNKE